jgi:hypothetical protein
MPGVWNYYFMRSVRGRSRFSRRQHFKCVQFDRVVEILIVERRVLLHVLR